MFYHSIYFSVETCRIKKCECGNLQHWDISFTIPEKCQLIVLKLDIISHERFFVSKGMYGTEKHKSTRLLFHDEFQYAFEIE